MPKARLICFYGLAPVLHLLLKTRMRVTYWCFAVWPERYGKNSLWEENKRGEAIRKASSS